jgi:regulator of protease activity HflC (stomatin/prohibitin superfamily)
MFAYIKAAPTTHILHYLNGKLRREGPGLSFLYFRPASTIVAVPLASTAVPFVFNEVTADFQTVTVQGQLTYRVADPHRISALLDFSIRPNGSYESDDPDKLDERLIQTLQIVTRERVQPRTLRDVLGSSDAIQREVLAGARAAEAITILGIEVLDVSILAIKPTPEIGRALEAEAREGLQRESDEAIYSRRNAAVEQERLIKESELNTEIAVQQKQRQIRENKVAADIAVEERRSALIERKGENERRDADSRAYALRATLEPVQNVDWKKLMALSASGGDPKLMIALAFRELAENAGKIGELNVTPDLLQSLIGATPKA